MTLKNSDNETSSKSDRYGDPLKGGISSDFMTYIKIVKNLVGFTFLVAPIGLREFSLISFGGAFISVLAFNLFLIWL